MTWRARLARSRRSGSTSEPGEACPGPSAPSARPRSSWPKGTSTVAWRSTARASRPRPAAPSRHGAGLGADALGVLLADRRAGRPRAARTAPRGARPREQASSRAAARALRPRRDAPADVPVARRRAGRRRAVADLGPGPARATRRTPSGCWRWASASATTAASRAWRGTGCRALAETPGARRTRPDAGRVRRAAGRGPRARRPRRWFREPSAVGAHRERREDRDHGEAGQHRPAHLGGDLAVVGEVADRGHHVGDRVDVHEGLEPARQGVGRHEGVGHERQREHDHHRHALHGLGAAAHDADPGEDPGHRPAAGDRPARRPRARRATPPPGR